MTTKTTTAPAAAATANKTPPTVTGIVTGITLPERVNARGGGAASIYPFNDMAVGAIIGVKDREKRAVSSAVSNINRKWKKPVKDESGNPMYETKSLTDQQGNVTQVPDTDKPKMVAERHYTAIEVTAEVAKAIKGTDLEGSKVLIQRDK